MGVEGYTLIKHLNCNKPQASKRELFKQWNQYSAFYDMPCPNHGMPSVMYQPDLFFLYLQVRRFLTSDQRFSLLFISLALDEYSRK